MIITLVTPAFRRFEVTRLCLAQRAHLRDGLAGLDIELRCVVVADDRNLGIAHEFGFDMLEAPNVLGRKVNDGIEFACEQGADWVCFCGSDDWLLADLFENLPEGGAQVVAGKKATVVDLVEPRVRTLHVGSVGGAPPWLIPRGLLEPFGFRPVEDDRTRGLEGSLVRALRPEWVFHDPHPLARVWFKSDLGITTWRGLAQLGRGPVEEPWPALAERYPAWLVGLARETSEQMVMVAA